MSHATVEDVRTRYSDSLGSATDAQVGALLSDAHSVLSVRLPDLDRRIEDSETTGLAEATKAIVCRAVMKAISNPLDASAQNVGGMGITYRSAGVYFSDRDLEALAPRSTSASDYARSVHVVSPFMR